MRELVVLGTASQVPTRQRNQNGYLLLWDGEGLLFDSGEGTQRQMTHAGVAASKITRICLTHVHGDHCYGLAGVLTRMALDGVAHPVHLHYPVGGEETVSALVSIASGDLDLRWHPHGAPGEVAPGLEVRRLHHRIETYGYRFSEPDGRTLVPELLERVGIGGPDVGRLQRDGRLGDVELTDVSVFRAGQRFAFVMDTAPCPGAEELAAGVDLLVAESTFADAEAELAGEYRHLTAGQLHTTVVTLAEIDYGIARLHKGRRQDQLAATAASTFADFEEMILPTRNTGDFAGTGISLVNPWDG